MKKHKTGLQILWGCLAAAAAILAVLGAFNLFQRISYPIKYQKYVEKYAAEYRVDPYLIYAVIRTESGFDPKAVSSAQARGLMQMTEETFLWLAPQCAPGEELTFDDLFDPETSIRFGTYYLSRSLNRYGDVATAAASYHSGWGTVDRLLEQDEYRLNENTLKEIPHNQMHHYVKKIERSYQTYCELYQKERR